MRVFAPAPFRLSGVDYPYGWQDLTQAVADTLLGAGKVRTDEDDLTRSPQIKRDAGGAPIGLMDPATGSQLTSSASKVFWLPNASGDTTGATDGAALRALMSQAAAYALTLPLGQKALIKNNGPQLYYTDWLEPVSNVDIDWGACVVLKASAGGTTLTNSLCRTFDAAVALAGAAAFALTFTVANAAGDTSATLSAPWSGATYAPPVIFPNGDVRNVRLTAGSTTVKWDGALSANPGLSNTGTGATYYGKYYNFNWKGGIFSANGNQCPAQILRFENIEDVEFENVCVIHTSGVNAWAVQQGGHRIKVKNCIVLNGTAKFQDGWHTTHGYDIEYIGGLFRTGDDPFALGADWTGNLGIEPWDDEGLRRVTITGAVVDCAYGTLKVYYGLNSTTGQPFAGTYRGTVDTVVMRGITGTLGKLGNGGPYVVDTTVLAFSGTFAGGETSKTLAANYTGKSGVYWATFSNGNVRQVTLTNGANTATWAAALVGAATASVSMVDPTRLQNIDIEANIDAGSALNDGINSNGIYVLGCTNFKFKGHINITDSPYTPYFALGRINMCMGSRIDVSCPQLPAGPGLAYYNCLNPEIINPQLNGGGGNGRGSIEMTGTNGLRIEGGNFTNVPTNGCVLAVQGVGSGDFANTYIISPTTKATKAPGATNTRVVIHQSAGAGFVTYAQVEGEYRGQSNATAVDLINSTTGFNPDCYRVGNVRGFINPFSVTWASSLAIPAVTGTRVQISQATGDTTFTVPASNTLQMGDIVSIQMAVDAGFTSGTRNVTFPANVLLTSATFTQPVATTDAGKKTIFNLQFDGTNFNLMAPNRWV